MKDDKNLLKTTEGKRNDEVVKKTSVLSRLNIERNFLQKLHLTVRFTK